MKKHELYESIMKNVAKQVKKALNEGETFPIGAVEEYLDLFIDEDEYGDTIVEICDNVKSERELLSIAHNFARLFARRIEEDLVETYRRSK